MNCCRTLPECELNSRLLQSALLVDTLQLFCRSSPAAEITIAPRFFFKEGEDTCLCERGLNLLFVYGHFSHMSGLV